MSFNISTRSAIPPARALAANTPLSVIDFWSIFIVIKIFKRFIDCCNSVAKIHIGQMRRGTIGHYREG